MKREYPDRPIVGVGGVVVHKNRVLLVRRGTAPLKGRWSIPGGMLELGEDLAAGVRRELREETGLDVQPLAMVAAVDRIERQGPRVKYHYVIVDYACRLKKGQLRPASDVLDARWVRREELSKYRLTRLAKSVILRAFELTERGLKGSRRPVAAVWRGVISPWRIRALRRGRGPLNPERGSR
jgi:8-oxo-dGTP diphosphatase